MHLHLLWPDFGIRAQSFKTLHTPQILSQNTPVKTMYTHALTLGLGLIYQHYVRQETVCTAIFMQDLVFLNLA